MRWKRLFSIRDTTQYKLLGLSLALEAAVVTVSLMVLISGGLLGVRNYIIDAKINRAKSDTASLTLAVARYAYDMGVANPDAKPGDCLPASLSTLTSRDSSTGNGPWLVGNAMKKSGTTFLDPWNNEYVYSKGSGNDGRFAVYSKGPDSNGSVGLDGKVSKKGVGFSGGFKAK